MRVLDITTLFPSQSQPHFGSFVFRRARELSGVLELDIAVGVGRFPIVEYLPRYHARRLTPPSGMCGRAPVHYLRFLSVPRYLKSLDGSSLGRRVLREIRAGRIPEPDLVSAELVYPDGEAARIVAQALGTPYTVTSRGHDLNDLEHRPQWLTDVTRRVLEQASLVTPVSGSLTEVARRMVRDESKVLTVQNGVDQQVFGRWSRSEAREALGIAEGTRIVLSVGHLVERKGHHYVVRAVSRVRRQFADRLQLVVVGSPSEEGDFSRELHQAIQEEGGSAWVTVLGAQPQHEVARWMTAADVLVLASSKEGRPNVVLESFAAGTPVVATRVWGTPELVTHEAVGELVERTVEGIAAGVSSVLARTFDSAAIRAHVREYTWERTAETLMARYHGILRGDI